MKIRLGLFIAGFLILLDHAAKQAVLAGGYSFSFSVISVGARFNHGAIFGIALSDYFIIAAALAALGCLVYAWHHFAQKKYNTISGGLLLLVAGGLSNLLDRLHWGAVVDFLAFEGIGIYFNLADIYILAGGITVISHLIANSIFKKVGEKQHTA